MSAICGLVQLNSAPVNQELLRAMAEAVSYQGPDGIHYWTQGEVGMAHLAFNTTFESLREEQPLLSADGLYCLTADARVDNRPELISILSGKGFNIGQSSTDADLILAAYQHWGEDCAVHIIGDFAFAIWDESQQKLFCARDVFGMKPFVYAWVNKTFCFASQAEQLLQHPNLPCRLDESKIAAYLIVDYNESERTFFENISALPAAHSMVVEANKLIKKRYWEPVPGKELVYKNDKEYAEHFRTVFRQAVDARLRTNSPIIGVQLSGGLDSSSLTAMAAHILEERHFNQLSAFTIGYDTVKTVDERQYSRTVAEALDIQHTLIINDDIRFISNITEPDLESPHRRWEVTETKMIKRLHAQGGRVMLTGVGGDDLVLGTPLIYADQIRKGKLWALRRLRSDAGFNDESFGRILYRWFIQPHLPGFLKRLLARRHKNSDALFPIWIQPEFVKRTNLGPHVSAHSTHRFWSWAMQTNFQRILDMEDLFQMTAHWLARLAMRHQVEFRHPFFDRRLIEFVLRLPADQLWRDGYSKFILRQSMAGLLPESIRLRPGKTYYIDVFHHTLSVAETGQISRLLERPLAAKLGYVDGQKLQKTLAVYQAGQLNNQFLHGIMRIISLEYWLKFHSNKLIS